MDWGAVTRVLLGLALLLMAVPTPGAEAQPADLVEVFADPTGDVVMALGGTAQDAPGGATEATDLVTLAIGEARNDFTFLLGIAGDDDTTGQVQNVVNYNVWFVHNDQAFVIQIAMRSGTISNSAQAFLLRFDDGQQRFYYDESLQASFDGATDTITVLVPRAALHDLQGAPPTVGRALEDIFVQSASAGLQGGDIQFGVATAPMPAWGDRMPDGDALGSYPVRLGLEQTGSARLWASEPFRASNGEASTFVYNVVAENLADGSDAFDLEAVGVPADWDVTLPAARLVMEGTENATLPIILRTQFAHEHGTARSFVLELRSRTDGGSVGRVELGIRYPEIAQPAGHHDTLHLHSQGPGDDEVTIALGTFWSLYGGSDPTYWTYMNTHPEDPADERLGVEGRSCDLALGGSGGVRSSYCWWIPLQPGLEMGLDFDLERLGSIGVPVTSALPAAAATLTGVLVHVQQDPDDPWESTSTVLAELEPGEPVDLGSGETLVEATIRPTPESDYIAYAPSPAMYLLLEIASDRVSNVGPGPDEGLVLMPGGSLQLPLNEYEDRLTTLAGFSQIVRLDADGPLERLFNPGATVLYNLSLTNEGPEEDAFLIDFVGLNEEWGQLLTPRTISLAPDGKAAIQLAVTAPPTALDGERADIIAQAISANDSNQRALLRLVATVDTDATHSDAASLLAPAGGEAAPGPAGIVAVFALVCVALWRRRL